MTNDSSIDVDRFGPAGPFGPVFQIIPGVQSYEWGKTEAQGSLVAKYASATPQLGFQAQPDRPYAELWMGTHPTLPSSVIPPPGAPRPPSDATQNGNGNKNGNGHAQGHSTPPAPAKYISLNSYVQRHANALVGQKVLSHFDTPQGQLPFLFKILSIGKALSIQAHPDKQLAKRLHEEKPKMYKDDNHKPEMAIALSPFKGFCGFRPLHEIVHSLNTVGEFRKVVNPSDVLLSSLNYSTRQSSLDEKEIKNLLQSIFSNLMSAASTEVKRNVMAIAQRYRQALDGEDKGASLEVSSDVAQLVCTLNEQFPGDVGVLCAFVLNVVSLKPGQAIFLKANEPHAYLEGEIVECMAASDNVVRAGLTPKARDVSVLVDMLTYDDAPSDEKRMQPTPFMPDGQSASLKKYNNETQSVPSIEYNPPIEEFSVVLTKLDNDTPEETHRALQGPSILIVTQGKGTIRSLPSAEAKAEERQFDNVEAGQVFFVGAQTRITLQAGLGNEEALITYRAFVEA